MLAELENILVWEKRVVERIFCDERKIDFCYKCGLPEEYFNLIIHRNSEF